MMARNNEPKLDKAVVIYMYPALIRNDPNGFRCGICSLGTSSSECLILDPSGINLENGVCALFVPGGNVENDSGEHAVLAVVPWEVAGYTEYGPTYCGICKNFSPPNRCKKVEGNIAELGCCNAWER